MSPLFFFFFRWFTFFPPPPKLALGLPLFLTQKKKKKSEVDSAKRLWDAGTDTPRGYRCTLKKDVRTGVLPLLMTRKEKVGEMNLDP